MRKKTTSYREKYQPALLIKVYQFYTEVCAMLLILKNRLGVEEIETLKKGHFLQQWRKIHLPG